MKFLVVFVSIFITNTLFSLQFIELQDGHFYPKFVVENTLKKLHLVTYNGYMGRFALYELLQKAKNCTYVIGQRSQNILKRHKLLDGEHLSDMVRSIVLSSISTTRET